MSSLQCYSLRQLSPFIGNIQVVEADYCRAMTADGQQWQIQASCETHQQAWNITDDHYIPRRYVVYGSWNQQTGFSSLPLDPMLDVPSVDHVQNALIQPLEDACHNLPFQPSDHYECWLIDRHHQPLALVASASQPQMIAHMQIPNWQAISSSQSDKLPKGLSANQLQQLEQAIAQQSQGSQWFHRTADGKGHALIETPTLNSDFNEPLNRTPTFNDDSLDETPMTILPSSAFSECLLNAELLSTELQAIFQHLVDWQSPRLLSLHRLSPDTHQQLEHMAQYQAIETYRRLSIYPAPLSRDILTKIQVEMKIRGL